MHSVAASIRSASTWPRAADVLLSAATVIVISSVGMLVVLDPAWVAFAQDRAGVPASMALSADEVRLATAPVLRAIASGTIEAQASDGLALFSVEERQHVQEAAVLLRCWWSLGAVALTLIALSGWRHRERIAAAAERGAFMLLMVTTGGTVVVMLAFGPIARLVHGVLFPDADWFAAPAAGHLVRLFPADFWIYTVAAVFLVTAVTATVVALVARVVARRPIRTSVDPEPRSARRGS